MSWRTSSSQVMPRQTSVVGCFPARRMEPSDPRELAAGEQHVLHEEIIKDMDGKITMDLIKTLDDTMFRIVISRDLPPGAKLEVAGVRHYDLKKLKEEKDAS